MLIEPTCHATLSHESLAFSWYAHKLFGTGRQTGEYTTAFLCSDFLYVLIGMV